MTKQKNSNSRLIIIVGIIALIFASAGYFLRKNTEPPNVPLEKVMHDYTELERSYSKIITDLEEA